MIIIKHIIMKFYEEFSHEGGGKQNVLHACMKFSKKKI